MQEQGVNNGSSGDGNKIPLPPPTAPLNRYEDDVDEETNNDDVVKRGVCAMRLIKEALNTVRGTNHSTFSAAKMVATECAGGKRVGILSNKQNKLIDYHDAHAGCIVTVLRGEHAGISSVITKLRQAGHIKLEDNDINVRTSLISILLDDRGNKLKELHDARWRHYHHTSVRYKFHNENEVNTLEIDNSWSKKSKMKFRVKGFCARVRGCPTYFAGTIAHGGNLNNRSDNIYLGQFSRSNGKWTPEAQEYLDRADEFFSPVGGWRTFVTPRIQDAIIAKNQNVVNWQDNLPTWDEVKLLLVEHGVSSYYFILLYSFIQCLKNFLCQCARYASVNAASSLLGDKDAQLHEASLFCEKHVQDLVDDEIDYSPYKFGLGHLLDHSNSGVATANSLFRSLPRSTPALSYDEDYYGDDDQQWSSIIDEYFCNTKLPAVPTEPKPDIKFPHFYHVSCHGDNPHGLSPIPVGIYLPPHLAGSNHSQNLPLNAAAWKAHAQAFSYRPGSVITYYQHCVNTFERSNVITFLGIPGVNTIDEYLKFVGKFNCCLMGSKFIEAIDDITRTGAQPMSLRMEHSPHISPATRMADNHNCYVGTDLALRLLAHRYRPDRYTSYGPGQSFGNHAYIYVVDGRFRPLLDAVGLPNGYTDDLAYCSLPLPVAACYKVLWNGPGLVGAICTRIF